MNNTQSIKSKTIWNKFLEFCFVFLIIFAASFISFVALEAPDELYEVELKFGDENQDDELIKLFVGELKKPGKFVTFTEYNNRFKGTGAYWKHNVETVGILDYISLFINLDNQAEYYRKMTIIRTIVVPLRACIIETIRYDIVKSGCDRQYELFLENGTMPKEKVGFGTKEILFFQMNTWLQKLDDFIEQSEYNFSKRETLAKLKSTKDYLENLHSQSSDELEKRNIGQQIKNQRDAIEQLDVKNTSEKNLSHKLQKILVTAFFSTAIIALFGGIGMARRFIETVTGNAPVSSPD